MYAEWLHKRIPELLEMAQKSQEILESQDLDLTRHESSIKAAAERERISREQETSKDEFLTALVERSQETRIQGA